MLDGNRVPAGARNVRPWWKEQQATWLPQSLPAGADCHHHAGPRPIGTRQLFCQVCLTLLEDEDGNPAVSRLRPSILREIVHDHRLETPRALTYELRLALARERLSAEAWERTSPERYWLTQEFMDGLDAHDDKRAVLRLWVFLGGPEGDISDRT